MSVQLFPRFFHRPNATLSTHGRREAEVFRCESVPRPKDARGVGMRIRISTRSTHPRRSRPSSGSLSPISPSVATGIRDGGGYYRGLYNIFIRQKQYGISSVRSNRAIETRSGKQPFCRVHRVNRALAQRASFLTSRRTAALEQPFALGPRDR